MFENSGIAIDDLGKEVSPSILSSTTLSVSKSCPLVRSVYNSSLVVMVGRGHGHA